MGTLDADRLAKIKQLEAYERAKPVELEPGPQKPVFTTPLKNLDLGETDHAHVECTLIPIQDPNLKVILSFLQWFIIKINQIQQ